MQKNKILSKITPKLNLVSNKKCQIFSSRLNIHVQGG